MNEMIHDCASSVENKMTNELKNYPLHDSLRDTKIEFSYCTHKSVLWEKYLLKTSCSGNLLTYKFNTNKSVCYMKTHQKEPKAEN